MIVLQRLQLTWCKNNDARMCEIHFGMGVENKARPLGGSSPILALTSTWKGGQQGLSVREPSWQVRVGNTMCVQWD